MPVHRRIGRGWNFDFEPTYAFSVWAMSGDGRGRATLAQHPRMVGFDAWSEYQCRANIGATYAFQLFAKSGNG